METRLQKLKRFEEETKKEIADLRALVVEGVVKAGTDNHSALTSLQQSVNQILRI